MERRQRARAQAATRAVRADEATRTALRLCARLPEPPLYRRRDEPARAVAAALLDEATEALSGLYAAGGSPELTSALELHLDALVLTSEGQPEAAQRPWEQAVALERAVSASVRPDLAGTLRRPTFDRETRVSRYDPVSASRLEVVLPCPGCRQTATHPCSSEGALQPLQCPRCSARFFGYLAEVHRVDVAREGRARRYLFHLETLDRVARTKLEVTDASKEAIDVGPRETAAFLYAPQSELRGVVDVTSKRVWWVMRPGACFVATAVFGADSPELDVLRAFRDEVLAGSVGGRRFIAWYYRRGPELAAVVQPRPLLRALVRFGLSLLVAALRSAR